MRVSVIGTGRIGFSLEEDPLRYKPCTHVGAVEIFRKTLRAGAQKTGRENISLEWGHLCDLDPVRSAACKKFIETSTGTKAAKEIFTTTDYREVLSARPDILVIATNTESHDRIALEAIRAGIRRIVIEKPVTLNHKQARKLYSLAEKYDTHIWVNYERRYHEKYRKIKTEVETGRTWGGVLHYRGWFAGSNRSLFREGPDNEGALLHDTTHLVDLAQFLFGEVRSFDRNPAARNIHQIAFSHKSGIHGDILTSINSHFFHFEMEILFERARLRVGNGFLSVEELEKSRHYKNFTSLGAPRYVPDKKMQVKNNPFMNLYNDVVHDIYETSFLKDACQNIRYLT